MKKTFSLTDPKIADARRVEAVKHEIKKYVKRERNKPLKNENHYWAFDCRAGASEETAEPVHVGDINKVIDQLVDEGNSSVYIEVFAKMEKRRTPSD